MATNLVPPLEIGNAAGEFLVSLRAWHFLRRPPVTLALVSGQSWITLPADFMQLVSLQAFTGWGGVLMTTDTERLGLSSSSIAPSGNYYHGVILYSAAPAAGGPPTPRIELSHAPGASLANAFKLVYVAGWTPLLTDIQEPALPAWILPLYVQIRRAFARGLNEEDSDRGTAADRMADIVASPIYQAAVRRDGQVQPDVGQLRGGQAMGNPVLATFPPGHVL